MPSVIVKKNIKLIIRNNNHFVSVKLAMICLITDLTKKTLIS